MTASSGLAADVERLLANAIEVYAGTPAEERLRHAQERIREPLRVAIAGKVKAGKSTLLNALIGQELAPTDAGECTKIITWYRDAPTYRVQLRSKTGEAIQVPFRHEGGALEVELQGHAAADVDAIEIDWPSAELRTMTLIDTPGIASLSADVSERTKAFLTPGEDEVTAADAVLYLMRHVHSEDVRFLEAFHDDELAQATPVNAIGILSRADELGVARTDAIVTAQRIADRYRTDPKMRTLCQTVVPVAGLLAQSAQGLREDEFKALAAIAAAPREETSELLLTVDRFTDPDANAPITGIEREHLLFRFGLYGVRVATVLIRDGVAKSTPDLARELLSRSGLADLRSLLESQFGARSGLLKARSALLAVEAVVNESARPGSEALSSELERIQAGAHELAEIRLLNALRAGHVPLKDDVLNEAERLLGAEGTDVHSRLGLEADADAGATGNALKTALTKWQRRAESPMSSREVSDAARVLVRTCEGLIAATSTTGA
jgi:hypothetical protein